MIRYPTSMVSPFFGTKRKDKSVCQLSVLVHPKLSSFIVIPGGKGRREDVVDQSIDPLHSFLKRIKIFNDACYALIVYVFSL